MMPILYGADETAFTSNGVGILSDAADCTVTEILKRSNELELKYPIKGIHFADIRQRAIILAKPNPIDDPQPYRVYRITKPMHDLVTVYAHHIAYDLMGITAIPFSASSAAAALAALKDNAVTDCPFEFATDVSTLADMTVTEPQSIWSLMGNDENGILSLYGGEYEFDKYNIRLSSHRGLDRGVSIRYGKNLTSLEQDENCAGCYTAVHPYWKDSDGNVVQLYANQMGHSDFAIYNKDGERVSGLFVSGGGDTYLWAKDLSNGGYRGEKVGWKISETTGQYELTRYI